MKGNSEFIVTLTVLDTLNEMNRSTLREITNAYAEECGISKTTAATRVKMAVARGKSIGFIKESPRGIYSLVGFGNFDCSECQNGMVTEAKRRGKGKGKGKGKKPKPKRRKSKVINATGSIKKKVTGNAKKTSKK